MTKPVLTPAEKEFLKAVIKPYKHKIISISKIQPFGFQSYYEIKIFIRNSHMANIYLPIDMFGKSYQFKGLELNTTYDFKTLGL